MSTIIKNYSESKFKSTFSSLDHATRMQRSQYLQSVNNFQQNEINRLEKKINNSYNENGDFINQEQDEWTIDNYKRRLANEKNYQYVNLMRNLNEANDWFTSKLNSVLNKIVDFGFMQDNYKFQVHALKVNHSRGLDVIIEVMDNDYESIGEVKSRLVWVDCYEKASHWRFITTFKKA